MKTLLPAGSDFHFCLSNRAYALGLLGAYFQNMTQKVFNAFEDIENDAEQFADREYERLCSLPTSENGPDLEALAEMAQNSSFSYYDDLVFVKGQVIGLAVAGLYHLWERTLKSFLKRELEQCGLSEETKCVHTMKFDRLVDSLHEIGYEVRKYPFYTELDLLRLVANVFKHGEGPSLQDLYSSAPEFFRTYFKDAGVVSSDMDSFYINENHFQNFSTAIKSFWETMPEYLGHHKGCA